MKKTIILIVCGILINNISYAKYSQNDKENLTILEQQNAEEPVVDNSNDYKKFLPVMPDRFAGINFNEPLQVPKDIPIKTRKTKVIVLGDATQQPFSAETELLGGFGGFGGKASPYLTRYLPKEKPTYATREVYKEPPLKKRTQ